jgi:hypothetical protein
MDAEGFLARADLSRLLGCLVAEGYRCIGPQVRDGAIVYGPLSSAAELPSGWHDRQGPGSYRLERDDSPHYFAWANGGTHIVGLTPTGRATVLALRFNNEYVVEARTLWIAKEWHPPSD